MKITCTFSRFFIPLVCAGISFSGTVLASGQAQFAAGQNQLFYREFLQNGSEWNREQGALNMLSANVALDIRSGFAWTFNLENSRGAVTYKGQSQGGEPSNTQTDENFTTWLTGLRYQPLGSAWYGDVSIGEMFWQRDIRENAITGELSEKYIWQLLQLSATWQSQIAGHELRAELGFIQQLGGTITVDLRPYGSGKGSAQLDRGQGYFAGLTLQLWHSPYGDLQLLSRYSKVVAGQSATGHAGYTSFVEPESHMQNLSYQLGWESRF